MMFKKDVLEEFLFLWSKAENIPFTNYEDALVNNYSSLDKPFTDYSKLVIGWHSPLKVEISENLLSLPPENRDLYLEYLKNRIENETMLQDDEELKDLLKTINVSIDSLNIEHNKELHDALNLSFKEITLPKDLAKFRNLHRKYYRYLLNLEREKVMRHLEKLNEYKFKQPTKTFKDELWFKVGVKLASGQMAKYYTVDSKGIMHLKYSYTAPRVAEELGDKKWEKDVLATLKNYGPESSNANKNIFNSRDKMIKIIDYCKEKGIPVISHFTDRLPPE
ncbi:hypothetical protein V8G61_14065 [Gaetbulibacter sp. M240]|uniref:hypothetical protein n=1 Tax=Gaetbulibacter sp. M240 TaxID=3126511 RepID=UPI00374EEC41